MALDDPIHGEYGGGNATPDVWMGVLAQLPMLARCGSLGAHSRPERKFSHAIEHMLGSPDDPGQSTVKSPREGPPIALLLPTRITGQPAADQTCSKAQGR
jgi:hypothetical protein